MTIRRSIAVLAVIIAILLIILCLLSTKHVKVLLPTASTDTNSLAISNTQSIQSTATNPPQTQTFRSANKLSPAVLTERQNVLSAMNDAPIVFYGKLEDQFGNPVVGAEITGHTVIYSSTRVGSAQVSTTSDANGYFELRAGSGESLGIVPHKEGYLLATTDTSFRYSYMYPGHFIPDRMNPTVIKMWKLQGAQTLVTIHKRFKIPYSGSPLNFDLVTGEIVPLGGDITITPIRPPGLVSERNPQDWGFKIDAVNGGLIETTSEEASVAYAAPANDYQSSYRLAASTNHHGVGGIQQEFFVQSRNGQVYSKLYVDFSINRNPNGLMDITFNGVANTNGSGNWEPLISK